MHHLDIFPTEIIKNNEQTVYLMKSAVCNIDFPVAYCFNCQIGNEINQYANGLWRVILRGLKRFFLSGMNDAPSIW